jgi:hypothetical protein
MIPFERYKWIANSFASRAWEHDQFVKMLCELSAAGVPTVVVSGPRGPIVVTWQRPTNA